MTVVGVLSLVADALFIGWSAFIVVILLVTTIGKLFGAKTIFDGEDPDEDDVYLERLDKLQESVDCLASRRLDSDAMRALQEHDKVCGLDIDETLIKEFELEDVSGICYSALDALMVGEAKNLEFYYEKLPDDCDKKHLKKRCRLEKNINYSRIMIEFYGFMHSHGVGAFLFHLRRKYFGDSLERKNNLEYKPDEV